MAHWAEADNYSAGPESGNPNKAQPSSLTRLNGLIPNDPSSAQELNHVFHEITKPRLIPIDLSGARGETGWSQLTPPAVSIVSSALVDSWTLASGNNSSALVLPMSGIHVGAAIKRVKAGVTFANAGDYGDMYLYCCSFNNAGVIQTALGLTPFSADGDLDIYLGSGIVPSDGPGLRLVLISNAALAGDFTLSYLQLEIEPFPDIAD